MTAALSIRSFSLPLATPLATAAGRIAERTGVAVRWRDPTDVGVGEATPLPGWTEPLAACREELSAIARRSADASPHPDAVSAGYPATRHAIHLARADAAARAVGDPLARHLAGRSTRTDVPLAALVGAADATPAGSRAADAAREGFPAVKCKVGTESVAADIDRIRAVRDAVGPSVEVRADANRAWSLRQAREALAAFDAADVSFVEEPLADPTPARLAELHDLGVGLALDETVCQQTFDLDAWAEVVETVVLKPMAVGGLDRAMALADAAADRDLDVVVSNTVDAVIARTAATHLAAAIGTDLPAGLDTADRLETDLAVDPVTRRDGGLHLPDAPGIGTLGPWDGPTEAPADAR